VGKKVVAREENVDKSSDKVGVLRLSLKKGEKEGENGYDEMKTEGEGEGVVVEEGEDDWEEDDGGEVGGEGEGAMEVKNVDESIIMESQDDEDEITRKAFEDAEEDSDDSAEEKDDESNDEGEETIVDSSFTYDPQGQSAGDQQVEDQLVGDQQVEEETKDSDDEADGDDEDDDDAWMEEV
jgi:hypothetical protein